MSRPSWIGQTLGGRYQILEIVGQGGMSSVYKAKDPNLQRVVAIKLIHSHLATDPKFVVRFEEEARAIAQLRHANIVQVFDFNHDEELYYMVQEFIPGETLQARLRRVNQANRQLALEETMKYTLDALNALGYAHQRGMIHRDVKPANIMLDVQGQAILMDFGIVKILGGETHTATGAVVGTAMYMSPELIRGEPPDERSDLYSLGVTLFEMVSGHPPFEADSAMTLMMMHVNDPLPNLGSLRPEVPPDLVAIIEKALAKSKDDRFSSAAEMTAALKRVFDRIQGGIPYEVTMIDDSPLASDPAVENVPHSGSIAGQAAAAGFVESAQPASASMDESSSTLSEIESTYAEPPPKAAQSNTTSPPAVPPAVPPSGFSGKLGSNRNIYIAVGLVAVIILITVGILLATRNGSEPEPESGLAARPVETELASQATATPEASPTEEPTPTITLTPTETLPPTATPTLTALPVIEPDPGQKFARINDITLNEQNRYEVDYETFEYTEVLPGEHVHFFFNTVSQEQAGNPGSGPWILWGGPRPFTQYAPSQRPANAAAMCALVANPDHSIQMDSGNCFPLPDQVVLTALQDTVCLSEPTADAVVAAELPQWINVMVIERTADSRWWKVQNPEDLSNTCWAPIDNVYITGELASLPVAAATEDGIGAYQVNITGITLDPSYNYIVEYETTGFVEAETSLHIHFFFDNVPVEQAGIPGDIENWIVYYGPRPFNGYNLADKPEQATQLCALVANPDHTVIQETGNCFPLP